MGCWLAYEPEIHGFFGSFSVKNAHFTNASETIEKLWLASADAGNRIAPIACGMREWESDSPRPILAIARREGIEITG